MSGNFKAAQHRVSGSMARGKRPRQNECWGYITRSPQQLHHMPGFHNIELPDVLSG
jgi:hypothetical protein